MQRKIFKGRIFSVSKVTKKLPNGKEAHFEKVDHPGASLVVPFAKDKIVFIRQYRGVIGKFIWELPAGKLDDGEPPHVCAEREIREETGYGINKLVKIGYIYTTPGFCNEKIHIFKAYCSGRKKAERDHDEIIRVRHFTRREIKRLFKRGKINDAKTIAALSFAGIL